MRKQQGWRRGVLASMAVLTLVVSWRCDRVAEPKARAVQTADPARILRQMSDTLAHARQLTFKATRQLDAALVEGSVVAESAEIDVSISRPQMIRARMVSGAGVRRFYADGHRVSLLDERMKLYATVS